MQDNPEAQDGATDRGPEFADLLVERSQAEFRSWLREDPEALGKLLQAPMMSALLAAYMMGMLRGTVLAAHTVGEIG